MGELVAFSFWWVMGGGTANGSAKEKKTSQPTHSNQTNQRKIVNGAEANKSKNGMKWNALIYECCLRGMNGAPSGSAVSE